MSASASDPRWVASQRRRVLWSSFLGSVIEWFDFYLYSIGAASVFATLFFPSHDQVLSMFATLGTLAVAYVVRPLGGIIYGRFGDRLGRKRMLVSSILLMGASTVLVGLLPTYSQAGFWAPTFLIVLRIVQGLAVAGEWGGAILMALEHSDPRRRGLWSCFTGMGISAGIVLASGCFTVLSRLSPESFLSWGWRVPFLFASVLIAVGLWVRLGVEESPVFLQERREAREKGRPEAPGLLEILRTQWRQIALAFGLTVGPFAISGVKGSFMVAYAISVGLPRSTVLDATTVSSVASVLFMLIGGWASDMIGRRWVVMIGGVLLALSSAVVYGMIEAKSYALMLVGMCLVTMAHGIMYGPIGAFISELFPTRSRFTGASLAYQTAGVIGGGFAPMIATGLLALGGGVPHVEYVTVFMVLCCAVGAVSAYLAPETSRTDLMLGRVQPDTDATVPRGRFAVAESPAGHPTASVSR